MTAPVAPSTPAAPALPVRFPAVRPRPSLDFPAFDVPAADLLAVLAHLRDDHGYAMLVDVTAIDHEPRSPRFTVVHHLFHPVAHTYLRLACDCPDDAAPAVPSASGLWPAADWHERETYDMFGIRFTGHPDLRRILMWDDYPYFPLRKDFPLAGIDTPLPGADVAAVTQASVKPAPMMGGPFVAPQRGGQMSEAEPAAKDESWTERTEKPA